MGRRGAEHTGRFKSEVFCVHTGSCCSILLPWSGSPCARHGTARASREEHRTPSASLGEIAPNPTRGRATPAPTEGKGGVGSASPPVVCSGKAKPIPFPPQPVTAAREAETWVPPGHGARACARPKDLKVKGEKKNLYNPRAELAQTPPGRRQPRRALSLLLPHTAAPGGFRSPFSSQSIRLHPTAPDLWSGGPPMPWQPRWFSTPAEKGDTVAISAAGRAPVGRCRHRAPSPARRGAGPPQPTSPTAARSPPAEMTLPSPWLPGVEQDPGRRRSHTKGWQPFPAWHGVAGRAGGPWHSHPLASTDPLVVDSRAPVGTSRRSPAPLLQHLLQDQGSRERGHVGSSQQPCWSIPPLPAPCLYKGEPVTCQAAGHGRKEKMRNQSLLQPCSPHSEPCREILRGCYRTDRDNQKSC